MLDSFPIAVSAKLKTNPEFGEDLKAMLIENHILNVDHSIYF